MKVGSILSWLEVNTGFSAWCVFYACPWFRVPRYAKNFTACVDSKNSKTSYSETQTFIDFYFYHFSRLFTLFQFHSSFKLLYSNLFWWPLRGEEDEEDEEEEQEEEEEEEPQPHLENSSQSQQSNRTSRDYTDADNAILVAANKFSSFKKLVKVFGFVLRFVSNMKQNKKPTEGRRKRHALHNMQVTATLSGVEIEEARLLIFRTFEKQHLTEFEILKQNKRLPRKSTLRALAPFFDEEN